MTMDEFKKKFAEIAKEMMEADPQNEFLQPPLWAKLTDLMSEDLSLTIEFLDNATEDEVDTAFCVVEGKNDKNRYRKIEECIDDSYVKFGKDFHIAILPSFSILSLSNWFIMLMQISTIIMSTKDIAEPRFGL